MKKFRRFLSLFLCFALLSTSLLGVFAEEELLEEEEEKLEEDVVMDDAYFEELYEETVEELEMGYATGLEKDTVKLGQIHTMEDLIKYIEQGLPYKAYDTTGMDDIDILLNNMRGYYAKYDINTALATIEGKNYSQNMDYLNHYIGNGRFEGFDYDTYAGITGNSSARTGRFAQCLATAYHYEGCKYYKDPEIKQVIIEIIQNQLNIRSHRFSFSDAWHRSFGTQFYQWTIATYITWVPLIMQMYDELPEEMIWDFSEIMLYMPYEIIDQWNTGTNAIWYAMQAVIRGVLQRDEEIILYGINRMNELSILAGMKHKTAQMRSTSEMTQPDGGYHMHGPTIYMSYATSAMSDTALLASFLNGTKYQEIFKGAEYLLEAALGASKLGREDVIAPWFYGRNAAIVNTNASTGISNILRRFYPLFPEKRDEIIAAMRHLLTDKDGMYQPYESAKYFFRSDALAVHRKTWSFWVRGKTTRGSGMEFNGNVSYKNFWGHNGTTQLHDGDTMNVAANPFMDWTLYNGVTAPRYAYEFRNSSSSPGPKEQFCGGVTDGYFASMSLKMNEEMGTSAKKSWFAFDEGYLSLGSDIKSSHWADVNTTIEQEKLDGEVYINGAQIPRGEKQYNNVKTVFHGGNGYYFPQADSVCIKNRTQISRAMDNQRNVKQNGTPSTTERVEQKQDMFALYIPHGKKPAADTYAVMALINTTPEALAEYAANPPISVVANTTKLHAAYHKKDDLAFATFFEYGSVTFPNGMVVKVDAPAMILVKHVDGKLSVSASNPYNHGTDLNVTITENGKTKTVKIKLPGVDEETLDYGGDTVTTII